MSKNLMLRQNDALFRFPSSKICVKLVFRTMTIIVASTPKNTNFLALYKEITHTMYKNPIHTHEQFHLALKEAIHKSNDLFYGRGILTSMYGTKFGNPNSMMIYQA